MNLAILFGLEATQLPNCSDKYLIPNAALFKIGIPHLHPPIALYV